MDRLPYATDDRRDGVVGLAFAMRHVAQLLLMCDQRDIGLSINAGELPGDTPRIFIYDAYPGGIGFSAPLFGMQRDLLTRTFGLISGCGCDNGCPTCVGPIGMAGPLAKTVALRLLQHLLEGQLDSETLRAMTVGASTDRLIDPLTTSPTRQAPSPEDVPF